MEIRRTKPMKGNKHNCNCVSDLFDTYKDSDAYVLGTGTSLSGFKWDLLNGKFTIALNDAVKAEGFNPTHHIFSDIQIWKRYLMMNLDPVTAMVCQRKARDQLIRSEHCKFKDQIFHFNKVGQVNQMDHMGVDSFFVSRTIATGGICLAWKLGAKRIFLLGVDGYKLDNAYYHDGTSKKNERRKERILEFNRIEQDRHRWWQKDMDDLKQFFIKKNMFLGPYPNNGIYNLSEMSTIDVWEKVPMKEVIGNDCFC